MIRSNKKPRCSWLTASTARRRRPWASRPPQLERLEARELLTAVDLGGLEFQSDDFTNNGTIYTIGQGGSALVGLTPALGKAFTPLVQFNLAPDATAAALSFDTADSAPGFTVIYGQVNAVVQGGVPLTLWQSDAANPQTFSVAQLLSSNGFNLAQGGTPAPVSVAKLAFTPAALVFADGPNGDTTQSEIQLQGSLTPPSFTNFNWAGLTMNVDGGNYVHIASTGISLDGASLSTSSYSWSAFGMTAAVTPTVAYSHVNGDTFSFGGSATLTTKAQGNGISAFDKVGAGLSLKIQDGGLVALSFNVTGAVNILQLQFATDGGNPLGFSYDFAQERYEIVGGLTTTFGDSKSSVDLNLGYANNPSDPGIVIENGILTQFNATINTALSLAGANLTTNGNGLTFSYDTSEDQFEMYGGSDNAALSLNLANNRSIGVTLGDSSNPGLLVKAGELDAINMGVSGQFSLAGMAVQARQATIVYSKDTNGDDQYMLSGTLAVTGIFDASLSLGTQAQPGIVIQNNDFQLDGISIELGKANLGAFTIQDLEVAYQKSGGDYTISGGATLVFPAGWAVGGSFSVLNGQIDSLGLSYTASGIGGGIPIGPSGLFLVSMSGSVANLDSPANLVVTASIGVVYGEEITILGKSATIFAATGTVTVDKDEFDLVADAYLGAYGTATSFSGLLGTGTANLELDWAAQDYSASIDVSIFDGAFQFEASFQMDTTSSIEVSAKAIVAFPKVVPFVGGKQIGSLDFLMVYQAHGGADGGPTGFAAGWAEVKVFGTHDFGVKYDMITKDASVIGTSGVKSLTSDPTPSSGLYYYYFQVDVPTDSNNAIDATTGTFGVQFTPEGGTQTIAVSTDGSTYIDQSAFSSANGLTLVPTLTSSGQITFDVVGSSTDPTVVLPSGQYYVRLTSTVDFNSADAPVFTSSFSYPKPTVSVSVSVSAQAASGGSEVVNVSFATTVAQAFQPDTAVSLYYDEDNSGYDGALVQGNVPLSGLTSGIPFDVSNLLPGTYYVYASIDDGTNAPVLSAYSVAIVPPPPPVSGTASDRLTGASLSGFTVFIDVDGDGQYAPGAEPGATTGPSGYYQFTAPDLAQYLTAGDTYPVVIVIPVGYQTDPDSQASYSYDYDPDDDQDYDFDFALDKLVSVSGVVYDDINQSGTFDASDPLRTGVTIYIDSNNNGQFDPGEPTATTDNSGSYSFDNVAEGQIYTFRMQVPAGSYQTGPSSGSYAINALNVTPTEQFPGNDFGLIRYSTISGNVRGYTLVDGRLSDQTEPLEGWTIQLMSGGTVLQTTASAADGSYSFTVKPGSYTVAQVAPSGWMQVSPVSTQLQFTQAFTSLPTQPYTLATGDFDGDGNLDYVVADALEYLAPTITILYGNGDGTFNNAQSPTVITLPAAPNAIQQQALSVVALSSNFGGNNLPDLAVLAASGNVYILKNNGGRGASSFSLLPDLTFSAPGTASLQMIAGNFTGHGNQDLAVSYADSGAYPNPAGVLFWSAATGKVVSNQAAFGIVSFSGSPVNPAIMDSADVNGDGFEDLVILGGATINDLSIIYGDGTGGANGTLPIDTIALDNLFPVALELGDINNDGVPDVLISGNNDGVGAAEFILGSGGRFNEGPSTSQMLPIPPTFNNSTLTNLAVARLADVNGDRLLDAIFADDDSLGAPLTIFTNTGSDSLSTQFNPPLQYFFENGTVAEVEAIAVLDLDGDGFSDLVISDSGDLGIHIMNNRTAVTALGIGIKISPDVNSIGNLFTNEQVGQLSGTLYRDLNRTGTREPGEPGVAGKVLYIDLNGNGVLDPSDPTATTNAQGLYAFAGLAAGRYQIRLFSDPGDVITTPGLGSQEVTIAPGRSNPSRNFGMDASLLATTATPIPTLYPGDTLRFPVLTSAAAAGRNVRFTLAPGSPEGMSVDPRTGMVTWAIPTGQALGKYNIAVRVYDVETPRVSEVATYPIGVVPYFAAPIVPELADAAVDEFGRLSLAVPAADPSVPAAGLTYTLAPSSPSGATIDLKTGILSWSAEVVPKTYTFTVLVANAARPDLITSRTFDAIVRDVAPTIAPITPMTAPAGGILTAAGSFSDPGFGGWTAVVDYGDGSGPVPLELAADQTFQIVHRYAGAGRYVATIVVRDAFNGVGVREVAIEVTGPPSLKQVVIGDGTSQRDTIRSLGLVFTGPVSIAPNAFELRGPGNRRIILTTLVTTSADGNTVATIRFAGPGTRNGALINGRYRLIVHSIQIRDIYGRPLAGNTNGTHGGEVVIRFRRLKGDHNGDGRVNRLDKSSVLEKHAALERKIKVPKGPRAHSHP